jgi:hypothetical protein
MRTLALPRIAASVLMASCLLWAGQQSTTPAVPRQTNPSPPSPPNKSVQPSATRQPPTTPPAPKTPKEEAWQVLNTACTGDKTSGRATAIRVLGLMPNDAKAKKLAEKALNDDKS